MSLNSLWSAVTLVDLIFELFTKKLIFVFSDNKAPLHLLGRNALIGVKAKRFESKGIILPCADKL